MLFDREALTDALEQLNSALERSGIAGRLNVVGGAALALHYFDRDVTADIDSALLPRAPLVEVAAEIAIENGWPTDWLNDKASQYLPQFGKPIEWKCVRTLSNLEVYVPPAEVLLAMKVRAARQKDIEDIAWLVRELNLTSIEQVDEIIETYSPGDAVTPKAERILSAVFAECRR